MAEKITAATLTRRKSLTQIAREANDPQLQEGHTGLKRTLTATQLTLLGVGGIVGAGIFSLTGTAAALYAGPGIVMSFMVAGGLCLLAGLCYAELAAMVPVAGSAYTYSYGTLGEFVAWIIGWDLVLEYTFGSVTVASSWSGYFVSLVRKTMGVDVSDSVLRFTAGPFESVTLNNGSIASGIVNLPALVISLVVMLILYRGMKESAWINSIIVVIKVSIILGFIALGWGVIDSANLIVNPGATGLGKLVPSPSEVLIHGREVMSYGWSGVLTGAGIVFFAYIGFDAVSTTAQEAKNPQRDLPIGILGSLFICTILYILMAIVMTGVVDYRSLAVSDPVAVGIDRIVELKGYSPTVKGGLSFAVKLGALAGLTSVIMVLMLGQTRVFYAMAKDGLLPWFDRTHSKYSTPHIATVVTGIVVALFAALLPITVVGELVSIGTLLAFFLVCLSIPILRKREPNLHRPFKVPFANVTPYVGAAACLWVMSGLPSETWLRLLVWLAIGVAFYFVYGAKHSRLSKTNGDKTLE